MTPHFFFDDSPWFKMIELDETTSTNTFLAEYHPLRPVDMVLVTTEYQSAGRGQKGNVWEAERGQNLLFSIMVQPHDVVAAEAFVISQAIALSIQQAISDFLPEGAGECTVKWPNDIYVGNCKIAGILIENDLQGRFVSRSIMGCGVNVNQTEFHLPLNDVATPVSLALLTGSRLERRDVLESIMARFSRYNELINSGDRASIREAYMKALYRREGMHDFRDSDGEFTACISSIEPTGHIHLTDAEGRDRRYAFKEVAFKN